MKRTTKTDIFQIIDSEEKAYWLGFIYADGSVDKYNKRLKVGVSITDIEHLEKLKHFLNHNRPFYFSKEKIFNKEKDFLCKPMVCLCVYSVEIYNSLQVFGIVPNKTNNFCLDLSRISEHLHLHFWRGMIDGDGCVVLTDKSRVLQLTGHKKVCEMFLSFIKKYFETNVSVLKDKNVFCVKFSKTLASKIGKFFYENATISLERKCDKAIKMTGKKNPVIKKPISVKINGIRENYESITNFCKLNSFNYKNVIYALNKHKKYLEYEFVSAT